MFTHPLKYALTTVFDSRTLIMYAFSCARPIELNPSLAKKEAALAGATQVAEKNMHATLAEKGLFGKVILELLPLMTSYYVTKTLDFIVDLYKRAPRTALLESVL